MSTVLDTLQKGTDYLEKYGIEDSRLNMQHLIAHVLKCDRMQVYVSFDQELSDNQLDTLRKLTKERAKGEPLQHLLGTVEFSGLEFKSDSRALIPRPETEELAEKCAQLTLPPSPHILDMGCGSGVLGLSIAHLLSAQNPEVWLADVSAEALELAEENRQNLLPDANIRLLESDLFAKIEDRFDLIIANLPYIPNHEKTSLSQEVHRDPELALYGGDKGTEVIEHFLEQAPNHLNENGQIALEFGIDQEDELKGLAENCNFENIRIIRDLCGINRFLFAVNI